MHWARSWTQFWSVNDHYTPTAQALEMRSFLVERAERGDLLLYRSTVYRSTVYRSTMLPSAVPLYCVPLYCVPLYCATFCCTLLPCVLPSTLLYIAPLVPLYYVEVRARIRDIQKQTPIDSEATFCITFTIDLIVPLCLCIETDQNRI
jgi:hypothetical protein